MSPRCPECGRDFDDDERAFLESGLPPKSTPGRKRAVWIGVVVIGLLLLSTVVTGILYYRTANAAGRPPAATQPAVTQPDS